MFTTQPRQHKLRPVVSEYGRTVLLAVNLAASALVPIDKLFPEEAKILSRHVQRGLVRDVFMTRPAAQIFGSLVDGDDCEILTVGVPWEGRPCKTET